MDKKFVTTRDASTANKLQSEGLQLVSCNDNQWVFINKPIERVVFDKTKVSYTNTLCI